MQKIASSKKNRKFCDLLHFCIPKVAAWAAPLRPGKKCQGRTDRKYLKKQKTLRSVLLLHPDTQRSAADSGCVRIGGKKEARQQCCLALVNQGDGYLKLNFEVLTIEVDHLPCLVFLCTALLPFLFTLNLSFI